MNEKAVLNRKAIQSFIIRQENELRLETSPNSHVILECTEGLCECFGAELVPDKPYSLPPGSKLGIFTHGGAKVRITGDCSFAYVSKDTPMQTYLKLAIALEQRRVKASREYDDLKKNEHVPKIITIGQPDSGKSSLVNYLTNFGVRCGRNPVLVDLDCGQNGMGVLLKIINKKL